MRPLPLAAAALLAASLSACVSMSRSSEVMPLAEASSVRVSEVRLTTDDGVTVRPEFAGIFQERVQGKLDQCATGSRPLRLEADISRLDRANPAQVLLIGGANVLRGSARLVDPATGAVVGQYEIGKTIVGSRLSIFQMAESEEQLSDAFGQELCDQAFGGERSSFFRNGEKDELKRPGGAIRRAFRLRSALAPYSAASAVSPRARLRRT